MDVPIGESLYRLGHGRPETMIFEGFSSSKKSTEKSTESCPNFGQYHTVWTDRQLEEPAPTKPIVEDANLKAQKSLEGSSLSIDSRQKKKNQSNTAAAAQSKVVSPPFEDPITRAKRQWEEWLQRKRSSLGDKDHPEIAEALLEMGQMMSRVFGDFVKAKQYLIESLQMSRSLHQNH